MQLFGYCEGFEGIACRMESSGKVGWFANLVGLRSEREGFHSRIIYLVSV